MSRVRWSLEEAERALGRSPTRFVTLLAERGWEIEYYAPRGHDPQQPHDRDEVYVVASGSGIFLCGEDRVSFGPGDLLFVPAGIPHRFEQFGPDLALWVIFHDPSG